MGWQAYSNGLTFEFHLNTIPWEFQWNINTKIRTNSCRFIQQNLDRWLALCGHTKWTNAQICFFLPSCFLPNGILSIQEMRFCLTATNYTKDFTIRCTYTSIWCTRSSHCVEMANAQFMCRKSEREEGKRIEATNKMRLYFRCLLPFQRLYEFSVDRSNGHVSVSRNRTESASPTSQHIQ